MEETVRSGPIYLETDNGTVTLVKEGIAPVESSDKIEPTAVYVIDTHGVRKINFPRPNLKRRLLALSILALAVFAFWRTRPRPGLQLT